MNWGCPIFSIIVRGLERQFGPCLSWAQAVLLTAFEASGKILTMVANPQIILGSKKLNYIHLFYRVFGV
jgi:hypothetical protein